MFLEFWYSVLAISAKITIPIPPSFTGNNSSFLSTLLGICPSIRAGIKLFQHIDQASVNVGRYPESSSWYKLLCA